MKNIIDNCENVNNIPNEIFVTFIESLFDGGSITLENGLKIVAWNESDRFTNHELWDIHKDEFLKYNLIEKITSKYNDVCFYQIASNGADIWRQIVKASKKERNTKIKSFNEKELPNEVKVIIHRYSKFSVDDLHSKLERYENERLSIMRHVARLQLTDARNRTSTCTKEFYGEKLARLVDDIEKAIEYRNEGI